MSVARPARPRRPSLAAGWMLAIAVLVLASGACVYVFVRPPGTAYLHTDISTRWTLPLPVAAARWPGPWPVGGEMPALRHLENRHRSPQLCG